MTPITEKDKEIIEQWYKDASKQTLETLPEFMAHVLNDYRHDYGTICRAIGACTIAAAWAANSAPQGGITGFQAGAVMWEFVRNWNYRNNQCGLRIVDYDDMLYPQYAPKFDKCITPRVMESLQREAHRRLSEIDENHSVHPAVKEHWEQVAAGIPPFGFKVSED